MPSGKRLLYTIVYLTTRHILYRWRQIPVFHRGKKAFGHEVRSFLSRRRSSSLWDAWVIHYEDGRHGDKDGRGGNEDGRHAGKGPNSFLNIQTCTHFDLLQAILREFSIFIVPGFTAFQRQRNCVFLFPACLVFPIVNFSYFKEEYCQTNMIRDFAPNRKSPQQGLLYFLKIQYFNYCQHEPQTLTSYICICPLTLLYLLLQLSETD